MKYLTRTVLTRSVEQFQNWQNQIRVALQLQGFDAPCHWVGFSDKSLQDFQELELWWYSENHAMRDDGKRDVRSALCAYSDIQKHFYRFTSLNHDLSGSLLMNSGADLTLYVPAQIKAWLAHSGPKPSTGFTPGDL